MPLASYSWDEDNSSARLYIPGAPRCYDLEPEANQHLVGETMEKDAAMHIDENHFRLRNVDNGLYPTEPVFIAIQQCMETRDYHVDLNVVDIVCDGSSLCKLVAWLKGNSSRVTVSDRNRDQKEYAPFAFDMDLMSDRTLLLTRIEETDVVLPDENKPTFGPSFERIIAKLPDGFHSYGSFYRVSFVRIGDLNLLVRSQVDAVNRSMPDSMVIHGEDPWYPREGGLQWKRGGLGIALNSDVVEMKTLSAKKRAQHWAWNEWYAQMVFKGASHIVLGFHKDGKITRLPTNIPVDEVEKKADESCNVIPFLEPLLKKLKMKANAGYRRVQCNGMPDADLELLQVSERSSRVPPWVAVSWPYFCKAPSELLLSTTLESSSAPSTVVGANVQPTSVSFQAAAQMLKEGLPSLGTVSHGSQKCCICMPHLHGKCERGGSCYRCHHPDHTVAEASHTGSRSRQRAARSKFRATPPPSQGLESISIPTETVLLAEPNDLLNRRH